MKLHEIIIVESSDYLEVSLENKPIEDQLQYWDNRVIAIDHALQIRTNRLFKVYTELDNTKISPNDKFITKPVADTSLWFKDTPSNHRLIKQYETIAAQGKHLPAILKLAKAKRSKLQNIINTRSVEKIASDKTTIPERLPFFIPNKDSVNKNPYYARHNEKTNIRYGGPIGSMECTWSNLKLRLKSINEALAKVGCSALDTIYYTRNSDTLRFATCIPDKKMWFVGSVYVSTYSTGGFFYFVGKNHRAIAIPYDRYIYKMSPSDKATLLLKWRKSLK